ncbi:formylglycine-generating enzyme family protein [bacterium]|nr:formylglycine-generating enzyme family protein [bacterium]
MTSNGREIPCYFYLVFSIKAILLLSIRTLADENVDLKNGSDSKPTLFRNKVGMNFVRIGNFEYTMGSSRSDDENDEEYPLNTYERMRQVTGDEFWIMTTEIKNSDFMCFVKETDYRGGSSRVDFLRHMTDDAYVKYRGDSHPVIFINLADVNSFCGWLREKDGLDYRLPTEEEWEYACKRGSVSDPRRFVDPVIPPDEAGWFKENSINHTHAVETKDRSLIGLFDMHGNVWEWTSSEVSLEIKRGSPFENETVFHIRGGSFINVKRSCRCASRWAGFPPSYRGKELGARLVFASKPEGP